MIYITGDTHGGFQRFGSKYFPQQTQMGRNDYMIICGDYAEEIVIPKLLHQVP